MTNHTHRRSTADASPSSSGTSASITKPSAGSAMDHQTIGDIIISNMHRRCSHEHRRWVADVSGTFSTLVYIAECSPTALRCSTIYRRWYLASEHREKILMHAFNFSRCPDALAKYGDYSRTSPLIRRTTGVWRRCPGDAQICASREHWEA